MVWIKTDYFNGQRAAKLCFDRNFIQEIGMIRHLEDNPEKWEEVAKIIIKHVNHAQWKDGVVFGLTCNFDMGLSWGIGIFHPDFPAIENGVMIPTIPMSPSQKESQAIIADLVALCVTKGWTDDC